MDIGYFAPMGSDTNASLASPTTYSDPATTTASSGLLVSMAWRTASATRGITVMSGQVEAMAARRVSAGRARPMTGWVSTARLHWGGEKIEHGPVGLVV